MSGRRVGSRSATTTGRDVWIACSAMSDRLYALLGRSVVRLRWLVVALWIVRDRRSGPRRRVGKIAARMIRRPAVTLAVGVLRCSAAWPWPRSATTPAARAPRPATRSSPATSRSRAQPRRPIFRYPEPVWEQPTRIARAQASLQASGQFAALLGPLAPSACSPSSPARARRAARSARSAPAWPSDFSPVHVRRAHAARARDGHAARTVELVAGGDEPPRSRLL